MKFLNAIIFFAIFLIVLMVMAPSGPQPFARHLITAVIATVVFLIVNGLIETYTRRARASDKKTDKEVE